MGAALGLAQDDARQRNGGATIDRLTQMLRARLETRTKAALPLLALAPPAHEYEVLTVWAFNEPR